MNHLQPEHVLCVDDAVTVPVVHEVLAHRPTTGVLLTDESPLRGVADAIVPLHDPDSVLRALPPRAARTPGAQQIGEVPTRETTPDLVSIVIPVHGAWDLTDACLDSIMATTTHPVEIIVVDDASPDDTAERLSHDTRVDRVVTCPANLGFAGAVNAGLRESTGEFVCILNNDTEVTDGWLAPLLTTLDVPGTGLVGPRTNCISGPQAIADAPGFQQLGSSGLHAWARSWRDSRPDAHWATNRLVGFCLVARRTLFEDLGGLDEGVGRGNFEDDELCARVRSSGRQCRVTERSIVLHHGSATFGRDRGGYMRAMLEGRRHTAGRLRHDAPVVTGVVLADGDLAAAMESSRSLLPLVEHVVIWARDADLGTAAPLLDRVDLRHVDWSDDAASRDAAVHLSTAKMLVLAAGEHLMTDDAVLARVELETFHGGLGSPPERRLVTCDEAGVASVGMPVSDHMAHLWVDGRRPPDPVGTPAARRGQMPRLDVLVAGVQKAGTTSLYGYLAGHPLIAVPKVKELHVFDDERVDWSHPPLARLLDQHGVLAPGQLRVDVTPITLFWPRALKRLRMHNPDVRIVVLFRDPIDRAWSHWKMERRRGLETLSFSEAIRRGRRRLDPSDPTAHAWRVHSYVERGFYGAQVERLLHLFPREQVLFMRSDDLRHDHVATLAKVSDFLDLDPFPPMPPREDHASGSRTTPDPDDVTHLATVYREDLARFVELTALDVSNWTTTTKVGVVTAP